MSGRPERRRRGDRQGMQVRREVLGDAHVDAAVAGADAFTGAVPGLHHPHRLGRRVDRGAGLDRRTRRCITLDRARGAAARGGAALHVRAALTNGLTREEIGEVLLHTAIYAGVPAANRGLRGRAGGVRGHRRGEQGR